MTHDFDWSRVKETKVDMVALGFGRGRRGKRGWFLHIDDVDWFRRAAVAANSKGQLIVALLVYRQCRMHRGWTVAAFQNVVKDLGISRHVYTRAIRHLERAGLIEVRRRHPGSAFETKVIGRKKGGPKKLRVVK